MGNKTLFSIILLLSVTASCQKELPPNPFDDPDIQAPDDSSNTANLGPTTIAGLHQNIFSPTCANSGCHDGTFEPDFRTIESTYNTLVFHPVIKNNPSGDFTFRVVPGNPGASVIIERLTNDIDGFSGIMPLETDPGSDWPQKKSQYIDNIRTWIENGAKDMFGDSPTTGNKEPQMSGVIGYADGGNTLLPRASGQGPLKVPVGASTLDLWFSITDDSTASQNLTYNKIKFSIDRDGFDAVTEENLQIAGAPEVENGYFGYPVDYYHRYTLTNLSSFGPVGTVVYFRIYVKDPQHDVTEIPEDGSYDYIKEYFAIELI